MDYGNTRLPWLDNGYRRQISGGFEFNINDVFSWEGYVNHDIDGWRPYGNSYLGASVRGLNQHMKWGHMNTDWYTGIRLYPYEQWHSESIRIRHKAPAGMYVSFGRAAAVFQNRGYKLETWSSWATDTTTNTMYPRTDSSFIHYTYLKIRQWSPQFGFGWKQYHNRYIYTDIAIYSNAYWRDNRKVTGYYDNDPRSSQPPYNEEDWNLLLKSAEFWARNGYGFYLKASIGINLDFEL